MKKLIILLAMLFCVSTGFAGVFGIDSSGDLTTGEADAAYLKLDASNGPITDDLAIASGTLTTYNDAGYKNIETVNGSGVGSQGIKIYDADQANKYLYLRQYANGQGFLEAISSRLTLDGDLGVKIFDDGTEIVEFENSFARFSKNVSIGNSAFDPTEKLHIANGNALIGGNLTSTGTITGVDAKFSGNVAIGTGTALASLHVYDSLRLETVTSASHYWDIRFTDGALNINGNELAVYYKSRYSTRFYTNSVERLRIASGGNVSVGEGFDAAEKLEVDGNVKISTAGNGIIFPDDTKQTTAFQDSYGGYYLDASSETAIATQSTWTRVLGATTETYLSSFTTTNNKLTYTGTDTKVFSLTVSACGFTDGSGIDMSVAIFINGSVENSTIKCRNFANNELGPISTGSLIELDTNDYVEVYIRNNTNTTDFTFTTLTVVLK